jgi:hypothetical protein
VRKTRDLAVCALLVAGCVSQLVSQSHAALFDFLRPRRAATTDRRDPPNDNASQAAVRRAALWRDSGTSAGASAVTQATFFDSGAPTGWGYDSSPCSDSECSNSCCKGFLHSLFCCDCCASPSDCFNCGEYDHCIPCTRHHRRKCNQTWYPRLAPYCEPNWGWTQPCWRRMDDNYNCPPRPQSNSMRPQRATPQPPAAPSAEPLPEPEPPAVPTTRREPARHPQIANPSPRIPRDEPPLAEKPSADEAQPTRFTGFADTLESEADADEDVPVEDTLESQLESADGDMEDEEAADPPAIEDAEE